MSLALEMDLVYAGSRLSPKKCCSPRSGAEEMKCQVRMKEILQEIEKRRRGEIKIRIKIQVSEDEKK